MEENKQKESEAKQYVEDMQKSLETVTDPGLKKTLTRVMERLKEAPVEKDIEEFKKEVLKAPLKEEQKIFAFLPHQMAKTSIFFPMSDRELKEENRKIGRIEHETGWGRVVIEGVKLAIFEEDIFLVLMKIAKDRFRSDKNGHFIETSMQEIVNVLYGSSGYTKKSFERVERALDNFQLVRFELATFDWTKKGKERIKTEIKRSIGGIVQSYKYNKETKTLKIYFNPHFMAYFLESMLTNIDFSLRRRLKKDGSKALLRFLSTHRNPGEMHVLTVLNAINFNTNQPMFKLRQLFKAFLKELRQNGVLGTKTKLRKGDTVCFDVLPRKKELLD
ncbi:MAG: hypothetical protein AUJ70_02565 [Candidatus Omnitrophica bacterium CG1_02_40_15]|nr:MAG: hypothetical protein AUJ70_02565 [Candidatus Omnitrophica bacterium CG1_02_40_15]